MQNFKIAEKDGQQIVLDMDTNLLYITVEGYAKMAEIHELYASEKAKSNQTSGVIYIPDGWMGIRGNYLIPASLLFDWLWVNNPQKARFIATQAMLESVKFAFDEALKNKD